MHNRSLLWGAALAVLLLALVGVTRWTGVSVRGARAPLTTPTVERTPVEFSTRRAAQTTCDRARRVATVASDANPELDVGARMRELTAAITSLIYAHLYEGEAGRELRRCAPRESARCQELLTAALYEVLAQYVEPDLVEGKLGAAEIESLDSKLVHEAAGELLERSADPVERVSMLALLTRATNLPAVQFPAGVYRDLGHKPVVEAQLLLGRSVQTGLPDPRTVEEVAYLAAAEHVDERVQRMALATLSRPGTTDSLNTAVRSLAQVHGPDWVGWSSSVSLALGLCGKACADVSAEVVASVKEGSDLATAILTRTPQADRGELVARFEPVLNETARAEWKAQLAQ